MSLHNEAWRSRNDISLENLSALVEGTLTNAPSITAFDDVSFDAAKVRRGDLFVALKHEDIQEAILNGAYGILFEKPTQITDQEIAWIKVDSIDKALVRLLRFHIMEKSPNVFSCDQISLKLASQITTSHELLVLKGTLREHILDLWNLEPQQYILFCTEHIDPVLFLNVKPLSSIKQSQINIVEQTLFETSFIYDDMYYERQLLSPFFIPYLETVLQFFKQERIKYQIRNFSPIDHFKPVFTNIHFEVKEFGKSDNVLIFESDFALVKAQIDFLRQQANWAKIIYIIPRKRLEELDYTEDIYGYDSTWDIMQLLKNKQYHFALIAEQNSEILDSQEFNIRNHQPSLF